MDPVSPAPAPTTPAPPVETAPITLIAKPSSKTLLWILAGVSLLGVGVVAGVFLGKQLYSQSVLQPTPPPAVEVTAAPDPTANWKTYTNTKFGYSIQYPPALTPLETTGDIYLHHVEFKGPEETYLSGIIVEVRNLSNLEEEVSYRKWQVVGHITDKLDSEIPISISGVSGKRLNYFSGQKQFSTIIVPYQKLVYTVEAESNLLDQILSTFKFTVN